MALIPQSELRDVHVITDPEKKLIKVFMQGAVYCWVKNREGEPFTVQNLVGGVNTNWGDTPLQVLYDKHIKAGKDDTSAVEQAGKDLGWLVKTVLNEDKRTFKIEPGYVNSYRWDGIEP